MKYVLRCLAMAGALLCAPAMAQVVTLPQVNNAAGSKVPAQAVLAIDSTGAEKGTASNPTIVNSAGATANTLMTNASASPPITLSAGIYNLQLAAAFNGATITLTATTANGTVSTRGYTSPVSAKTCYHFSAGTTVSIAASGGTPTGVTSLAGAAQCSQPVIENYSQLALVANTAAQIATPLTGMINGLVCTAPSTNTTDVLVGGSGVTTAEDGSGAGYPIIPGGSWAAGLSTTANTWFKSTAAAVIFCHGN